MRKFWIILIMNWSSKRGIQRLKERALNESECEQVTQSAQIDLADNELHAFEKVYTLKKKKKIAPTQ